MKNFKKGDKVVMFDCGEAKHNNGKIWECFDDSYIDKKTNGNPELVFLKGFSGSFYCKYLQLVKVSESKTPYNIIHFHSKEAYDAWKEDVARATKGIILNGS